MAAAGIDADAIVDGGARAGRRGALMAASNPLQQLAAQGQSVWLDYISRELLTSGELERLIAEDNVTGMTSNPTIFQKAIAEGTQYDDQIRELLADGVDDPQDIFLALAVTDIQRAADILRPVHDRTNGADGYVSLEVPPEAAHSTERSVSLALDFQKRVDRPNLMVKIPATTEGVPAIERALVAGVNINVTLIFALESYDNVIHAYLDALRARQAEGRLARRALGGVLLREPRRHRRRQAHRGEAGGRPRQRHAGGPARQGRHRQRRARLREVRELLPRRGVRPAGAGRGACAAAAVGQHQRQEPQVPRRRVRRGAGRPRHRRHHAAVDDHRLPRPRHRRRAARSTATTPARTA